MALTKQNFFGPKKSAEEWLKDPEFSSLQIIDPDGWDRKNFEASWKELITRVEMRQRVAHSTVASK